MRRAFALACLWLTTTSSGPALAAEACHWEAPGALEALVWDRLVMLERRYVCPGAAQGELHAQMHLADDVDGRPIAEETYRARPHGRWPTSGQVHLKGFPSGYCRTGAHASDRASRLEGEPGKERVAVAVPLVITLRGTGDMQPLSGRVETAALCPRCERRGGSVALIDGRAHASRLGETTLIRAEMDRSDFECARVGATLAMRFFAAGDRRALAALIRPVLVLGGLEKEFRCDAARCVLERRAPRRGLCAALGSGRHALAWELGGVGELARLGGGGRSVLELACP